MKHAKILSRLLSVVLCAAILAGCGTAQSGGSADARTATGTAAGFGGQVSVTLTMDAEGNLTDVAVTGDGEPPDVGGKAIPTLQAAMKEAGSVEVDAVAGATVTSDAVLAAAGQAWNELNGVTTDLTVSMAPGTYEGQATGLRSAWPMKVSVTVDQTRITDIQVTDTADTVGIIDSAIALTVPRILESQSVAVDAVSGATVSSNAIKEAVKQALTQALEAGGSDPAAIAAFQVAPAKSGAAETIETDVLVVGMGAAGTTAALSAAETMYEADPDSVSVLAIDKAGRYGGASSLCSGVFAVNPPKLAAEFNGGNDWVDRDALLADWMDYTEGDAKQEMVELLLDNCGETLDWLVYDYGLELEQPKGGLTEGDSNIVLFSYAPAAEGMTVRRRHNIAFFDNCIEQFTEMDGKYQLETAAYDFIQDENGKTVGVKARNTNDGTEYEIYADSIILATGGFGANAEMEKEYLSDEYYPLSGEWSMVGMRQNDGKMIQAALDDGAGTYSIGMCPVVHITGAADFLTQFEYHELDTYCAQTDRNTVWTEGDLPNYLGNAPDSLVVNTEGERFTSEQNMGFNGWMSGPTFYTLYSDAQIKEVEERGIRTQPAYMQTVNLGACGWAPEGTPIPNATEVMDAAVEAGYVYKADTLADLAEQLGMDPAVLEQTVADYNAACEAGVDEEFGKDAAYLAPIAGDGPYYMITMLQHLRRPGCE